MHPRPALQADEERSTWILWRLCSVNSRSLVTYGCLLTAMELPFGSAAIESVNVSIALESLPT